LVSNDCRMAGLFSSVLFYLLFESHQLYIKCNTASLEESPVTCSLCDCFLRRNTPNAVCIARALMYILEHSGFILNVIFYWSSYKPSCLYSKIRVTVLSCTYITNASACLGGAVNKLMATGYHSTTFFIFFQE
jgi:hypothetical protein